MEKYILGENIIITTRERYEKTFKNLGYKPYKETSIKSEINTENETENEEIRPARPARKRKVKED